MKPDGSEKGNDRQSEEGDGGCPFDILPSLFFDATAHEPM